MSPPAMQCGHVAVGETFVNKDAGDGTSAGVQVLHVNNKSNRYRLQDRDRTMSYIK